MGIVILVGPCVSFLISFLENGICFFIFAFASSFVKRMSRTVHSSISTTCFKKYSMQKFGVSLLVATLISVLRTKWFPQLQNYVMCLWEIRHKDY